jgi:hypothetical protein
LGTWRILGAVVVVVKCAGLAVCVAAGVAGGEGPSMSVAGTVAVAQVVVVEKRVSIFVGWRRVLVIAVIESPRRVW